MPITGIAALGLKPRTKNRRGTESAEAERRDNSGADVSLDLLKWKLFIVSGLAGTGLGINGKEVDLSSVLLVIPFASLYVDALCYHLDCSADDRNRNLLKML